MKRLATTSCLLLLLAMGFAGYAQCPSDKRQLDIAVSYGVISASQLSGRTLSPGETLTYSSGKTFVTLRYFMYNRLAFGFTGGFSEQRSQFTDIRTPAIITAINRKNTTTVAVELYYVYTFGKYFEIYTLAGIGPGFTVTNATIFNAVNPTGKGSVTNGNTFQAQYTPVGFRFGGRIGCFAELGVGYKGIFNAGLSFKLGPSSWWKE